MGMFTEIQLDDGSSVQIKCGYDSCDHYKVGDAVHWYVDPEDPGFGKLLDDVYDGIWSKNDLSREFEDRWVVIKDHRVAAVLPIERIGTPDPKLVGTFTECDDTIKGGYEGQRCMLRARYDIAPLTSEMWSQNAWAAKAILNYEREEAARQYEAATFGMTPEERATHAVSQYTKSRLSEDGIGRQLFPTVTSPPRPNT